MDEAEEEHRKTVAAEKQRKENVKLMMEEMEKEKLEEK
jgi:hypothetical protein